jgi:hypothetical protein
LRRSTLSWCRRTRISASNAARGRNSPIKVHQINVQRSLIGSEYQPTRARRASPEFAAVIRRVENAGAYADIAPYLVSYSASRS